MTVIDNKNTASQLTQFVVVEPPKSGRVVGETGLIINLADLFIGASDLSGSIKVIQTEHSRIHTGTGWNCCIETGSIVDGADYNVLIRVSAGVAAHLRHYSVTTSAGPAYIRLYEEPTISATGSAASIRNRNRAYADTDGVSIFTGPTVSAPGTLLETDYMPDTTAGGQKDGGSAGEAYEEWILNADTDYLIRLTNNAGAAITAVLNMFWYNHS